MFNNYNGTMECLINYVNYYIEKKVKNSLYERYVASCLGAIAGAERSYDDLLMQLENVAKNGQRTAENIKTDLIKKFNKGGN